VEREKKRDYLMIASIVIYMGSENVTMCWRAYESYDSFYKNN